jgi:hypothetical protein
MTENVLQPFHHALPQNKNNRPPEKRQGGWLIRSNAASTSDDRFSRALGRARAAVHALIGIDRVGAAFKDRLRRARFLAATAANALVRFNLVSHFQFSFAY